MCAREKAARALACPLSLTPGAWTAGAARAAVRQPEGSGVMMSEPTTALTDYLLALTAGWLAWRLLRRGAGTRWTTVWAAALAATAIAATTGGTAHGFIESLPGGVHRVLWLLTLYSSGIGIVLMVAGVTVIWVDGRARNLLLAVAALCGGVFLIQVTLVAQFRYVAYLYAPALAVSGWIATRRYVRARAPGAGWVCLSLALGLIGVLVQGIGLGVHQMLNRNDLFHLFEIVSVWCFFRGGVAALEAKRDEGSGACGDLAGETVSARRYSS